MDAIADTSLDYFGPALDSSSDFFELENNRSILQEFSDIRPSSPLSVESVSESPAGIPENNK